MIRLGVESFDGTYVLVLVRAAIEEVARTFREQIPGSRVEENVWGREVAASQRSFLVVQFRGQPWTVLRGLTPALWSTQDRAEDARALSGVLETDAIFFGAGGQVGALVYQLYRRGDLVEAFEVVDTSLLDDIERQLAPEETEARTQLDALRAARGRTFASRLREVDAAGIEDPRGFTEAFIRDCGAYVPALDLQVKEPGPVTVTVPDYTREDFERVDLVAL
jgi:hypothetical protein